MKFWTDFCQEANQKNITRLTFVVLGLLGVIVLYRGPLSEGLWLDETISYWVIDASLRELWGRVLNFQGQSPLYFSVLWLVSKLGGNSEIVLRMPSLVFMGFSCILLYRIASLLVDKNIAAFVVLSFIAFDEVLVAAFSARPYSAALMFALLSFYTLILWLSKNKGYYAVISVVAFLLSFYCHYLFLGVLLVHLAYVLMIFKTQKSLAAKPLIYCLLGLVVGTLPGFYQILILAKRTEELAYATSPSFLNLLGAYAPIYIMTYLCVALLFVGLVYRKVILFESGQKNILVVLLIWFFIPPLFFFLSSHIGEESYFIKRYFLWQLPSLALLLGWIIATLKPLPVRITAICIFALLVFVRESERRWYIEDWRGAIAHVAKLSEAKDRPLLVYTGLIEADNISWLRAQDKQAYLLAPFAYYPTQMQLLGLPSNLASLAAKEYFDRHIKPSLNSGTFVFLCADKLRHSAAEKLKVYDYYKKLFIDDGFHVLNMVEFEGVIVFTFSR